MTIFELVKIALDELYSAAKLEHGLKVDKQIAAQLSYLSRSYGDLLSASRKPINYKDPAVRFAYVYKYVAAHGDYIVQVLQKLQDKRTKPIFGAKHVQVSCIGGGPGSDIIAVLKYLDEYAGIEPVSKVRCYLLDGEQSWADAWTELDERLKTDVAVNTNFQPLDVANPLSWRLQKKFLHADLFTMSYFVSEVAYLDSEGVVSKFWTQLFTEAKPGAFFLYIDNGSEKFNQYIDKISKGVNLAKIMGANNVRFIPRFSEQASELAEYNKKFSHNPKIQTTLSYRVLRKKD